MKELALYLGDVPLGKVRVESVRGKEVFSFWRRLHRRLFMCIQKM